MFYNVSMIKRRDCFFFNAMIVDNMLTAGKTFAGSLFLHANNLRDKFETVAHGPRKLHCFWLNIVLSESYKCIVDGDRKFMALELVPLRWLLRKDVTNILNIWKICVFFTKKLVRPTRENCVSVLLCRGSSNAATPAEWWCCGFRQVKSFA